VSLSCIILILIFPSSKIISFIFSCHGSITHRCERSNASFLKQPNFGRIFKHDLNK
jgi:hypothetical protein